MTASGVQKTLFLALVLSVMAGAGIFYGSKVEQQYVETMARKCTLKEVDRVSKKEAYLCENGVLYWVRTRS